MAGKAREKKIDLMFCSLFNLGDDHKRSKNEPNDTYMCHQ